MENSTGENRHSVRILAAGVVLRLFYVLFSSIYERQYDIGMIDLSQDHTVSGGHLAYIQFLYQNGRLPDIDPTTVYQFNHPPFYYTVSALWLRTADHFIPDTHMLEESLQTIPLICAIAILFILFRIIKQAGVYGRGEIFCAAVFSFHPALVMLSGSVNNDCMGLMFVLLCIYGIISWDSCVTGTPEGIPAHTRHPVPAGGVGAADRCRRSRKYLLLTATSLGLGIMTKQSTALMAFPIGIVFAAVFFRTLWSHKNTGIDTYSSTSSGTAMPETSGVLSLKELLCQFTVFLVISVPLAMWFYIRNLLRYATPLVWVYTLPEDSWQYVGDVPLRYRFLLPGMQDMLENLRTFQLGCGYNVWMQIIRTSVLGEWDMAATPKSVKLTAAALMAAGAVLAAAALISMYARFIRRKAARADLILLLTYLVHMVSYLKFAYDYPQECSMNFRYIAVTILPPAAALGKCLSERQKSSAAVTAAAVLTAAFCLLSLLMTAIWCTM